MFGFNFGNKDDEKHNQDKGELEQFFEDEDWDIGQKGGEVEKEGEIDWSNYDFMHTFDDIDASNSNSKNVDDADST